MIKIYQQNNDLSYFYSFLAKPEIAKYHAQEGLGDVNLFGVWIDYHQRGVVNLHKVSGCAVQIHGYILRSHRAEYEKMMLWALKWFKASAKPPFIKLNASIPTCFEATVKITGRNMTYEGTIRKNYLKNNKVYDTLLFGILLDEIGE